jgi:hypothetical protein
MSPTPFFPSVLSPRGVGSAEIAAAEQLAFDVLGRDTLAEHSLEELEFWCEKLRAAVAKLQRGSIPGAETVKFDDLIDAQVLFGSLAAAARGRG